MFKVRSHEAVLQTAATEGMLGAALSCGAAPNGIPDALVRCFSNE